MDNGPIYIGGLDRCGKTIMRAFLASHPRIAIPPVGSNMWTYFYGQYGDLSRQKNFERCLTALLHYTHLACLEPDPARIREEFWQGPPTYGRLFALLLQHYAEAEGKPRWGAQTGMIERYADHLFASYPGLKMIHMLRDPRDRYEASLARAPEGKGRAGGATARWRSTVRLAERNQQRYPAQYHIVRYETLVSQPERTLRTICHFLNEDFVPSMLTMDGAPEFRSKIGRVAAAKTDLNPVTTDFIGRYRQKIPRTEIAFIQILGGRDMVAYGYSLDPIRFSPREWMRFAAVDGPLNLLRMAAWNTLEAAQQRFPRRFGRKPSAKTIVTAQDDGQSTQLTPSRRLGGT